MTPVTGEGAAARPAPSQSRRTPRSSVKPKTTRPAATPSPTRTIQVGREHIAISGFLLKTLQRRAAAAGFNLDVGVIPTYTGMDASDDDPERPARILAHALARGADRFPLLRKVSRQVEGVDAKAGLGADIASFTAGLCVRNQESLERWFRGYVANAEQRRAAKAANGNGGAPRRRFRHNEQEATQ